MALFPLKLLAFIIIIFIALLVHELGHFIAARIFGIPITSVNLGRGRTISKRTDKNGIVWCLHRWPLGAHVELSSMDTKPFWQRMVIILAGPAISLFLPFILFAALFLTIGQPSVPPIVVGVQEGLMADKAGFEPGDVILAVNNQKVKNYADIKDIAYVDDLPQSVFHIRRGEKELDISIKPERVTYFDMNGIERNHPRFGIFWKHTAIKLRDITSVNGVDVKGNKDKARKEIVRDLDKIATVGVRVNTKESLLYRVYLSGNANDKIQDKYSEEYSLVFLSMNRDNFYLKQAAHLQLYDALVYALERIKGIASLPVQMIPIDQTVFDNESRVTGEGTKIHNLIYRGGHLLAVVSIFLGLLNLLPFPSFDGAHIAQQTIERVTGNAMTTRGKALLFGGTFVILYCIMLLSNVGNIPRYIDTRMKRVQEYVEDIGS